MSMSSPQSTEAPVKSAKTAVEELIYRNKRYSKDHTALAIEPTMRSILLCCSDHRADPAVVLGLKSGEAVVIRNAGGRVTPAAIQDLVILGIVGMIEGIDADFELIVMQHTDCGTSRLAGEEYHDVLSTHFGIESAAVPGRCVHDPMAAVRVDLELLRTHALIPKSLAISGLVFDVNTGHVTRVAETDASH